MVGAGGLAAAAAVTDGIAEVVDVDEAGVESIKTVFKVVG
jgi:hypothetical protein